MASQSHPRLLPQFLLPGPPHRSAAFRTEPQTERKSWKPLGFRQRTDGIVRPSNPKPPKPGECDLCLTPGKNPFPGICADGPLKPPARSSPIHLPANHARRNQHWTEPFSEPRRSELDACVTLPDGLTAFHYGSDPLPRKECID